MASDLIPEPGFYREPHYGTDRRGRFRYTDYDGEELVIWGDEDGDVWVDKRGEGPVFIRKEHIALIADALSTREPLR